MSTQEREARTRPAPFNAHGAGAPASPAARTFRLAALSGRWEQCAAEYVASRTSNDQETMTNLRGLMMLIQAEIGRLGGEIPAFPGSTAEHQLGDE